MNKIVSKKQKKKNFFNKYYKMTFNKKNNYKSYNKLKVIKKQLLSQKTCLSEVLFLIYITEFPDL